MQLHVFLHCATSQSIVSLCADSPAFTTAWSWPCLTCWVFGTSTPGATRPYFASNAISMAFFVSFAVQPSDESGSSTNTRLFGLNGCGTITLGITQLAGCPFLGCEVCGGCWAQPLDGSWQQQHDGSLCLQDRPHSSRCSAHASNNNIPNHMLKNIQTNCGLATHTQTNTQY